MSAHDTAARVTFVPIVMETLGGMSAICIKISSILSGCMQRYIVAVCKSGRILYTPCRAHY